MNTSWKRLLFVVAALLSITLVITACGGAEAPAPAPEPTEAPAEEAPAEEEPAEEEPAEEEPAEEEPAEEEPAEEEPAEEEPAEEEPAEEEAPEAAGEPVTIKWFMRWDQTRVDNVAMPVIEAFEAENPNIKVEFENIGSSSEYYQKLQTMVAGGLAPDVFYPATHVAYAYASKGAMGFIDEFIDADGLDMGAYDQNILQLYQYEGKQYCLPIDTANLVVFYNQEMFDAAGVAYPSDGWTWDDFLTTAQALTADTDDDGIIDQFGTDQFVNYWPAVVWSQTGQNIFNDKRGPTEFLLTDPAAVEAVQWLADLINVHGVMPSAEQRADIGDMFVAGKSAMQVVGHWRVPRYLANAEFAFDFATLPAGEYQVNRADGSCFAIGATSEHPEEAWEFVKFLAGPESIGVDKLLELQQMVPVITEFQQSDAFLNPPGLEGSNKAAFLAGKDNLFSMYDPIHPMYSEWDALWKQEFGEVWNGNSTAQDAVDYMAPLVNDMLAQIPEEERATATEEAPAEEAAAEEAPAEAAGDPVTIKWFMRWDQTRVDNVAMPVIEAFEAENPNIKVEFENIGSSSEYYQKLQTMVAGGLAPDVFYPATHVAYAYASKGAMGFIDEFIDADGLDMDAYDQNILQLYQYEGKQYCLPIDTANLVVFYNQDMFDAAGVAYPSDGWTWDDFLTTAQALTADTDDDGIIDQFGTDQFVNYWPAVVWSQTGQNIFNDKRGPTEFLLTDPAAVEAVQWLADLINVHGVMPSAEQRADIGDMFVAGKSAMQVVGHWRVPRYLANAEFGFDFATLPAGEYQVNRADGSCFAIGATSEHPEEAWEFVKFLAGPGSIGVDKLLELQQMVPVITEFQQSDAFLNPPGLEGSNKAAFLAGKDNLFSMYDPIHPMYAEWDALWKQEFGEVWNGNTTAQDAVDYMAPLVDDMLAQIPEEERATVTEEPAEEAAAEEAPAEAAGDPVTIKWFMRWDQTRVDNVAMPVIEAFEAENPNITVEFENIGSSSEYYQKLQTMTAGGLAPDVFYPATHVAYAYASKGAMGFVDEFIDADGLDMDAYDQNILQLYQYEGKQYCLPIDTANLVVFYNQDMFDAAGVAYPSDGWTWDDFLTTAQALTADTDDDGIIDQFGTDQFVNYWPAVVWSQTGQNIFNDKRGPTEFLLTDPAAVEAVQWLADLINVHGVMPSAEQRADIGDMFVAGKSAMQVVGHWRVPRYTANAEFAFDFATLPAGEYQVNRADGSCFAMSSTTEHPEAAWKFVKFLAGPESIGVDKLLELQQMVPVITEFQQSDAFLNPPGLEGSNKAAFLAGKDNLFSMYDPIHPMYAEWDALWKQEFGEVWNGNTTAQDAVDYMTPLVQDMLNNLSDYE